MGGLVEAFVADGDVVGDGDVGGGGGEDEGEDVAVPVQEEVAEGEGGEVLCTDLSLETRQYWKVYGRKRRVQLYVIVMLVGLLVPQVQLIVLCQL